MLASLLAFTSFLAQEGGAPPEHPGEPPGGSPLSPIFMFGALFVIFWLFVLKPQKQRENEEKSMLDRLKKNDHVVTKGGMLGIVMNVKDDEVTLKIDEQQNVKVRFQKSAIAAILTDDDKSKAATEEKKA